MVQVMNFLGNAQNLQSNLVLVLVLVLESIGPLDSRTRTTTSTRFPHRATLSARKPAIFWREKRGTVVILLRGFARMLSCQNKS